MLRCSFFGTPEQVRDGLIKFIKETAADEIMATGNIFEPAARLRSYELLASLAPDLKSVG